MKISEGAEACVYLSKILGIKCVVKVRNKKEYRIDTLDNSIRQQRTRIEAKIMALAHNSGINVPSLFLVSKYGITMEFMDGKLLSELTDDRSNKYLTDAGRSLGMLHNINVAHGDFTTANLMVNNQKLYVIDFGLSEIVDAIEPKALDLLLMRRSLPAKKFKMFISSYKRSSKNYKSIIKKYEELELRGRYQQRTMQNL